MRGIIPGGPLAMLLARPLALTVLGIVLLLEVIFLAESLTTRVENVLRVDGSLSDIALLLAFKSPEIIDLALPLAILVAVFVVIGEARSTGELSVFAAAGMSWRRVVGFTTAAGVIAGLAGFLIAGFVVPTGTHAQRLTLDLLTLRHVEESIRSPGESGAVRSFGGVDFVAVPSGKSGAENGVVLIFNDSAGYPWRFATTRDWRITGAGPGAEQQLELRRLTAFLAQAGDPSAPRDLGRVGVDRASFGFRVEDIVPRFDPTPRARELPILSLAGLVDRRAAAIPDVPRLARALVRAALVPTAALVGLVVVLLSDLPGMRYLALPTGLVLIAGCDIAGPAALTGVDPADSAAIAAAVIGLIGAYAGIPLAILGHFREALMIPRRAGR